MKKYLIIIALILSYSINFGSEIPIDSIVRKPQVTDVSISMDGKYIAALYTDSCDKEKFLSYNVDNGKTKFITPDSYHDVCDYYWVSNNDIVYYLNQEKRLYYHYLIKMSRDLDIKSKRLFVHAWGGTHILDGLLNDPDYMLVHKIPRSKRLTFEKMHIQKGTQKYRETFKGTLLQSESTLR